MAKMGLEIFTPTAGELVLPSQLNKLMKRDLVAAERSWNPGFAALAVDSAPYLRFYFRVPPAWTYDTSLIAGIQAKLAFGVEASSAGTTGTQPTIKAVAEDGDESAEQAITASWVWYSPTVTFTTIPTGLTWIEIREGTASSGDRIPSARRGGTDGVPADRANVNFYFDDGS